MTDHNHQPRQLARAAVAELQTVMLDAVEAFTREAQVATALLAVLAQEVPITALVARFDLASERNRHAAVLDAYETHRRNTRVAIWRVMLSEGCSIGEISRIFGVSRQLVSRQLRDAPSDEAQTG